MASASKVAIDRQQPPSDAARRRLGRFLVTALVAGLALFHSQLLWQRIASFTLFEPLVALRWSATVLLLAGFIYLQRAGVSVIWGHKALVLWLLVLLCHAGTVVPVEDHLPLAKPGLLLTISFWSFALWTILGMSDRLGDGNTTFTRILSAHHLPDLPRDPRFLEPLSPRPPPAG